MDAYHVALFIHLFALMAATAASALVHFAEGRCHRATTAGDARDWHAVASSVERVFPLAIVILVATGGYMISRSGGLSWRTGWIDAGIAGTVLLLLIGATLGYRGRVTAAELARLAQPNSSEPLASRRHDSIAQALGWANTLLATAIVFVMATKPSLYQSLAVLAIGIAVGMGIGLSPARNAKRATAGEASAT